MKNNILKDNEKIWDERSENGDIWSQPVTSEQELVNLSYAD